MSGYDEQIGRNIQRLRDELTTMDQAEVALRMRLRGWHWDVEVVQAVETGARPVLKDEAEDLTRALGFSMGFINMRTDVESEAEVAEHRRGRAELALREAIQWWCDVADRYVLSDLIVPASIESVIADGTWVESHPDVVTGEPVREDGSLLLSTWEDLPVRPRHPLDGVEVGVPYSLDQIRMQCDYDLREASDGVRYATICWLRADATRAIYWPDDPRTSAEHIAREELARWAAS